MPVKSFTEYLVFKIDWTILKTVLDVSTYTYRMMKTEIIKMRSHKIHLNTEITKDRTTG